MSMVAPARRSLALFIRQCRLTTLESTALRALSSSSFTAPSGSYYTPVFSRTSKSQQPWQQQRNFSASAVWSKKGGKAVKDVTAESASQADPSDFSELESDIESSIERLKDDLSKLRAGGRFNPEVLENMRVQPDKNNKQTVKLSDLAQVVPKGRTVQIIVGEKDHIKPITSTIQASSLSLTPQPDPTGQSPQLLVINIPPPTAESRKVAVDEASKARDKAGTAIRDARGKAQKKVRVMEKSKAARPDDVRKALAQMEKVVEKGTGEIKKMLDNAKKVLESG